MQIFIILLVPFHSYVLLAKTVKGRRSEGIQVSCSSFHDGFCLLTFILFLLWKLLQLVIFVVEKRLNTVPRYSVAAAMMHSPGSSQFCRKACFSPLTKQQTCRRRQPLICPKALRLVSQRNFYYGNMFLTWREIIIPPIRQSNLCYKCIKNIS